MMSAKFSLKTLSAALVMAFAVCDASSATLGRMTVLSTLEQPLVAEIELTGLAPGEASTLVARLASPADYREAGLEVSDTLRSMRFVVESKAGRTFIKIGSPKAINEPLIDLLLEIKSANGRMVREYNFLLDPPSAGVVAPVVAAPASTVASPGQDVARASLPAAAPALTPTPVVSSTEKTAPALVHEVAAGNPVAVQEESPGVKQLEAGQVQKAGAAPAEQAASATSNVPGPLSAPSPGQGQGGSSGAPVAAGVSSMLAAKVIPHAPALDIKSPDSAALQGSRGEGKQLAVEDKSGTTSEAASAGEKATGPVEARFGHTEDQSRPRVQTYRVRNGNSLYRIAAHMKLPGVTRDQMVLALYNSNQASFVNGSINRLRTGSTLVVPSADVALAVDPIQAHKSVVAKMSDFSSYQHRLATQVTAANPAAKKEVVENSGATKQKAEEPAKPVVQAGLGQKDALKLSRPGKKVDIADEIAHEKAMAEANGRVKQLEGYVKDLQTLVNLQNKKISEQH
jgi:pilus assembly protein FimV